MAAYFRTLGLAAMLLAGTTTASAHSTLPRVEVCVADPEHVDGRVVLGATMQASRIYAEAGIAVIWVNSCSPDTVVLTLLTGEREKTMIRELAAGTRVLGFALASARRVYIFYDRISVTSGFTFERLLERVIAHEIGHVLLPGQGHCERGLMRAQAALAEPATFTDAQRTFMRRFVTEGMRAARTAH